jgi:hypothetical protein
MSNMAGVGTRSCAMPLSTVETVTATDCKLYPVRSSSNRKGTSSERQMPASGLK